MADVTLSAAVRGSLLSLQGTTDLVERTQNRLSSGLKVGSAIDDPVAFFQAKTLSDRAFDFNEKKDGVDQGVSTVTAAIDGLDAVESLVRQLKGLAQSLKSATGTQFSDLITQYNDLRGQVDLLTADATYQGVNLINGTGQTLTTEFSDLSTSKLSISSVDVRNDGLNIIALTNLTAGATTTGFNYDVLAAGTLSAGATISVTYAGATTTVTTAADKSFTYGTNTLTIAATAGGTVNLIHGTSFTFTIGGSGQGAGTGGATGTTVELSTLAKTYTALTAGNLAKFDYTALSADTLSSGDTISVTYIGSTTTLTTDTTFTYGTNTITISASAGSTLTLTQGTTYTFTLASAGGGSNTAGVSSTTSTVELAGVTAGLTTTDQVAKDRGVYVGSNTTTAQAGKLYVKSGTTTTVDEVLTDLTNSLTTLRSNASSLGSNVALLNTRLDFTQKYVDTLESGSAKLTLADINEEGANLLALQTRQQLGIQSLSFAGQAEQAVLGLFR